MLVRAPLAWFLVWAIALPLNPIGGLLFLDEVFGTGPRGLLRRLLRIHVAIAVVLAVIDVLAWLGMASGDPHLRALGVHVWTFGTNVLRAMIAVSSIPSVTP